MTDYRELVKALRCGEYRPECGASDCPYWSGLGCMDGKLITDAADAIEALQAERKKTVTQIFGEEQMAWEGRCKDLMYQIADLQAQLPKRGEWVHGRETGKEWVYDHWVTYYEDWHCSNCCVVFEQESMPKYNYCPNCGAEMEVQG